MILELGKVASNQRQGRSAPGSSILPLEPSTLSVFRTRAMGTEIPDFTNSPPPHKKGNSESSFQTLCGSARTSTRLRGKGCSVSRLCTPHHMDDDLPVPPPLPAQSPGLAYRAVQFGMPSKISGGTDRIFVFKPGNVLQNRTTCGSAQPGVPHGPATNMAYGIP